MKYLADLNDKQQVAVTQKDGPLLIIAGAGTGKTKLLIYRILHLIKNGINPDNILAVTFTNKAAKEMAERLNNLLASEAPEIGLRTGEHAKPFMSTFHALGVHILRTHSKEVNRTRFFSILDHDDALTKIKRAMQQTGVSKDQFEPKKILNRISRAKGEGHIVDSFIATADGFFEETVSLIWKKYNQILIDSNAFDFDDLLVETVRLLRQNENIRRAYQKRWPYIHVDEYQDTNPVQYSMIKLLAGDNKNICVVGDIDQSIYSWRGADFTNIFTFEEDFPQSKTVILEQNYRSTDIILQAANTIIEKNINRKVKNLFTENKGGEKITLYCALDAGDEARFISSSVIDQIAKGVLPENIAVLYRANFQSRSLEESFLRNNLPYQVLGVKFFDRREIKDLLAYIKTALNDKDFDSMARIINTPKRGIGKTTVAKLALGQKDSLNAGTQAKVNGFYQKISKIKNIVSSHKTSDIIRLSLEESDLAADLRKQKEEGLERLENLQELVTLAQKYDHLTGEEGIMALIEEASLVADQDNLKTNSGGVKLMTVHASKGLEFDTVFVSGLEQGLFPHEMINFGNDNRDEEEERRLFYVAITRARKELFLTYAQIRTIFGKEQINSPSEFLSDIPDNLLK
ncbi:MAG: UvrD-helicase domain-containing protein, partial [Candidatus Paceibacterota bacterium]